MPFINSHLMAPSPPREIEPITRKDAYEFWDAELGSVAAACSIAGAGTDEWAYGLRIVGNLRCKFEQCRLLLLLNHWAWLT